MPDDSLPLHDYVEHIYGELQGEMDRRYSTQEKAVAAATTALDKRLDGMNEFRLSLADILGRTVTRDVFDNHLHSSEARFGSVETRLAAIEITAREGARLQASAQAKVSTRLVALGIAISVVVVVAQILISVLITHHVL